MHRNILFFVFVGFVIGLSANPSWAQTTTGCCLESGINFCNETASTDCTSSFVPGRSCDFVLLCTCGDGIIDLSTAEECDDGNVADGDGCSAQCEIEAMTPRERREFLCKGVMADLRIRTGLSLRYLEETGAAVESGGSFSEILTPLSLAWGESVMTRDLFKENQRLCFRGGGYRKAGEMWGNSLALDNFLLDEVRCAQDNNDPPPAATISQQTFLNFLNRSIEKKKDAYQLGLEVFFDGMFSLSNDP